MNELIKYVRDVRREFHKIPEPAYKEYRTTELIREKLAELGLELRSFKVVETGGYCDIGNPDEMIVFRADIDGLPIVESEKNRLVSENKGFMHACGHDYHISFGIGLAKAFAKRSCKRGLKIIFQPAEESPDSGGEHISKELDYSVLKKILAVHVSPYIEKGVIKVKPGAMCASSSLVRISIIGPGGHTSAPEKTRDLIYIACNFVANLNEYLRKSVDPQSVFTLAFGKIRGGESHNVIPDRVQLSGSLRTLDENIHKSIEKKIGEFASSFGNLYGIKIEVDIPTYCPPVINSRELFAELNTYCEKSNYPVSLNIEEKAFMGADDFSFYCRFIPGLYMMVGGRYKGELHSPELELDEELIDSTFPFIVGFIDYLLNK